ncbi:MAG: NAD-dependent epimerase/dehydratase family protein [Parabacteroides sp.]|nr:NAD-dependent epimerase/dehydratase family protein [Parabacteroides sp.]
MDFKKVSDSVNSYVYRDLLTITKTALPWEQLAEKTVLITGAGGFIGYYLVHTLLVLNDTKNLHIHVIGLVRNEKRARQKFGFLLDRDDFELVVQDVIEEIRISQNVDYIIHAASQASNIQFETDPVGTINANVMGTVRVLEYARRKQAISTLFISSLKVYGTIHDGSASIAEEMTGYLDHTDYKNCYAQGKRAAETICASYIKEYGMNIKIARPAYIYGASSLEDDRVWAQFMANVIRRENIVLKSSGGTYRSFCYLADTVAALFTILLKGANGQPYNISSLDSNVTIREFAKLTADAFPERKLALVFQNKADEQERDSSRFSPTPEILDNTRITQLGWEAQYALPEGIRRSVQILEESV